MDGYHFLFATEDTPSDDLSCNSDTSEIDEETSNYLYSQIYYDPVPEDESSSNVPVVSADDRVDVSSESNAVLTSTPAAKDRTVPVLSIKATPITNDKATPNIRATPATSDSTPHIENEACTDTCDDVSVVKSKVKKKKKDKKSKKSKNVGENDLPTKSAKKRNKDSDKKMLEKLMQPIVLSDSDPESGGEPAKKRSKARKAVDYGSDYSDSESRSRSVGMISKASVPDLEVKAPKITIDLDSESSDMSIEAKSAKVSKCTKSGDGSLKRTKKPESKLKVKRKKMYEEHVEILSDSDSDVERVIASEDIIEIDSDLHDKIIDVSDDSVVLSDDGAPIDSLHVNMVTTPKTNGKVSLLCGAKPTPNSLATTPNRSIPVSVSVFDSPVRAMEDAFKGLQVNMNLEDSPLVKSINEGIDLSEILDSLDDCDWSTDYSQLPNSSKRTRYYTNMTGTKRRPFCQKCKVIHLSESECRKREPTCYICCEKGHFSSKCPEVLCVRCSAPDHRRNDCPSAVSRQYMFCNRCQMKGHKQNMCPDIWRQYHATTNGSEVPVRPKKSVTNPNRSCANCASTKHFVYDCPESRPSNVFVPYTMIAQYDSPHQISQRAKRNTQLPKELKYIDAAKEEEKDKQKNEKTEYAVEENNEDCSDLNGSQLMEKALDSAAQARGKADMWKRESQNMRRNNGGNNPKKWVERDHSVVRGSQQRDKSAAAEKNWLKRVDSEDRGSQQRGTSTPANKSAAGKKSSQTEPRQSHSLENRGFRRSHAIGSASSQTGKKRSQSEHQGLKRSNSMDSSPPAAKQSRSEDRDFKRGKKSSEASSSQAAASTSGSGELRGCYEAFLKTAPQTTQKLNTLKNKLRKERKEKNRERKQNLQQRAEQNDSSVNSGPNPETKKKRRNRNKSRSSTSNEQNPWIPNSGDFKNSSSSKSAPNKRGGHQRKDCTALNHIHVRHPNFRRDRSTDRQTTHRSFNDSQDRSSNNSQSKKKKKKVPIYMQ